MSIGPSQRDTYLLCIALANFIVPEHIVVPLVLLTFFVNDPKLTLSLRCAQWLVLNDKAHCFSCLCEHCSATQRVTRNVDADETPWERKHHKIARKFVLAQIDSCHRVWQSLNTDRPRKIVVVKGEHCQFWREIIQRDFATKLVVIRDEVPERLRQVTQRTAPAERVGADVNVPQTSWERTEINRPVQRVAEDTEESEIFWESRGVECPVYSAFHHRKKVDARRYAGKGEICICEFHGAKVYDLHMAICALYTFPFTDIFEASMCISEFRFPLILHSINENFYQRLIGQRLIVESAKR